MVARSENKKRTPPRPRVCVITTCSDPNTVPWHPTDKDGGCGAEGPCQIMILPTLLLPPNLLAHASHGTSYLMRITDQERILMSDIYEAVTSQGVRGVEEAAWWKQ